MTVLFFKQVGSFCQSWLWRHVMETLSALLVLCAGTHRCQVNSHLSKVFSAVNRLIHCLRKCNTLLKLLWHSDAIGQHRSGSTLAQVSLVPGGTNSLSKGMLTDDQSCSVVFTWEQLNFICSRYSEITFLNYCHVSPRAQWIIGFENVFAFQKTMG